VALYGPAIKKLIPPGPNDPPITPRVVVLHVAVSESESLYDYFNGPSGGVESHFYIRRDGTTEQYRDTALQADANTDANNFAISVETQGLERGEWTAQQLASIKALLVWCNDVHGIPLQVPTAWDGSGVGYHTLFPGVWDKRGASCPGPDRKAQFVNVLVPWMATGEEDDMPITDADVQKIVRGLLWYDGIKSPAANPANPTWQVDTAIAETLRKATQCYGELQNIKSALTALADTLPDEAAKSVLEALSKDYDANVQLTPKETPNA
jgi:hypothetical protein